MRCDIQSVDRIYPLEAADWLPLNGGSTHKGLGCPRILGLNWSCQTGDAGQSHWPKAIAIRLWVAVQDSGAKRQGVSNVTSSPAEDTALVP